MTSPVARSPNQIDDCNKSQPYVSNKISVNQGVSFKESNWSDWKWSEEMQKYYATRYNIDGEMEYYYYEAGSIGEASGTLNTQYEAFSEATTSLTSSNTTTGNEAKARSNKQSTMITAASSHAQNFKISRLFDETTFEHRHESGKTDYEGQFKPRKISEALDAVTKMNVCQYGVNAEAYNLEWLSAEGISATVLIHHLTYFNLKEKSKIAAKDSCRMVFCDKNTEHFDFGDASVAFYVYGNKRGFVIGSSMGHLSNKQKSSLKSQSVRYALNNRVSLKNLFLTEFDSATWIYGGTPEVCPGVQDKYPEQYAGGLICSKCTFWSPYGLKCTNQSCKAWFSATGANANGLHPKEDAAFGIGGMAIMAIIGMVVLGGAVRGA